MAGAMTCLACGQAHPSDQPVKLHTGEIVSSYSEAWRHECEARSVLALPTDADRVIQFNRVAKIRGQEAADALRQTTITLWRKRRAEFGELRDQVDVSRAIG